MVSIFSSDHLPWLNGTRLCITLPRTLNLLELPRHVYLQDGFNKLVAFADAVNNLSLESTSPYPVEARALIRYANMHQILSDINTAQGSIFKANPKLHSLCRLAILLYIHAVFLGHSHQPKSLREEIMVLRNWLSERLLDRFTSIESLVALVFCHKQLPSDRGQDPAPLILQMIMVAKRFSRRTLDLILMMFFGYPSGMTFNSREVTALGRGNLGRRGILDRIRLKESKHMLRRPT
jgi:hypothetical protein